MHLIQYVIPQVFVTCQSVETTNNMLFSAVSRKSCVMLLFVWTVNIRMDIESYFTVEIVHVFNSRFSVIDNKISMMEKSVEVL